MPANTIPIYPRMPDVGIAGAVIGTTANTATDGTGSAITLLFTADSVNGSLVYKVILKSISTIAATVVRIWYCSATGAFTPGTTNTAVNTTLIAEIAIAAWTVSQTTASPQYEVSLNMAIPLSTKILISFGTSTGAGTTGFNPTVLAGDY